MPSGAGSPVGPDASVTRRAPVASGLGERVAHLSARAIGDEADRIDRLPRRAGRDEKAQAREVPARARREPPGLLDDRIGLGHPSDAARVRRRGGRSRARSNGRPARRGSACSPGPPRGSTSPTPWRERGGPVRRCARKYVDRKSSARPCANLPSVCAVAGATSRRSHQSASSTWSTAGALPEAQTSVRTSCFESTAKVSGATNSRAPRVIATCDVGAAGGEAAEDFDGLVGGDAPAHAEKDARGHAHGNRGGRKLAGRLFLDEVALELAPRRAPRGRRPPGRAPSGSRPPRTRRRPGASA